MGGRGLCVTTRVRFLWFPGEGPSLAHNRCSKQTQEGLSQHHQAWPMPVLLSSLLGGRGDQAEEQV